MWSCTAMSASPRRLAALFRIPCSTAQQLRICSARFASSPNCTHLLALAHALRDPCLDFGPGLVDGKEASFASALDQLVGLDHERGAGEPRVILLDFGKATFRTPLEHFGLDLEEASMQRGHQRA